MRFRFPAAACRLLAGACLLALATVSSAAGARNAAAGPLDDFIADYAKAHDFSGTVLVWQDGRRLVRSFGQADIAHGVANAPDTRYWVASITKLFTAALVLQLHERGRLDLQATVASYLPGCTGEGARKVTVHQLLNHTSGLRNFDQVTSLEQALTEGMPNYQLPHAGGQLARAFCNGPLAHAPGTAFDYDNGDYLVLGRIIERVTGQTFEQVLRERILAPLHLADTGVLRHADIVHGLASTYTWREDLDALANDLPVYPENWGPAGAIYSTVDDLLAFADALFDARLIGRDSLTRLTTPGLDEYGYGLWVYETKIGNRKFRVAKRPGRIMGAQAQLYRFLDRDLTVVVLANTASTDLDAFVAGIGQAALKDRENRRARTESGSIPSSWEMTPLLAPGINQANIDEIINKHKVTSVSFALIENGVLVFAGASGQARSGVAATPATLYNIASLTKPISAEVALQLAAVGAISMDENMSEFWTDPDISGDPRRNLLTPRIALAHKTGFPNWRDGRLAFERDPGESFGYSGEGYEYMARFILNKTKRPIDYWADRLVFSPNGMRQTTYTRQPWLDGRMAFPHDSQGKELPPQISNSPVASDNIFSSPGDYAQFISGVIRAQRNTNPLSTDRLKVQADRKAEICKSLANELCPALAGMALGWELFAIDDVRYFMHTGSDDGTFTFAYFSPDTGSGAVIFTNSSNGSKAVLPILRLTGKDKNFVDFLDALVRGAEG